jgi:16S rRNA (cytidine1402-2'-O)-methyltransferase
LPGTLYLVATPIGNLEDITLRALRVLREEATLIACEDTRQTRKLLDHYNISKPLVSYHEHNEDTRAPDLIKNLMRGEAIALVSDAGTPLISDPGYRLVALAIKEQINVVPVPGLSAVMAALSASGLRTDEFRFKGFLPPKRGARRQFLEALQTENATVIVYESPHRILEALEDISAILSQRPLVLARELTKVHEEFLRGSAGEILQILKSRTVVKGEITLLIGKSGGEYQEGDPVFEVTRLQSSGIERMEAIKTVARRFGLGKREIYRMVERSPEGIRSQSTDKV